MINVLMILLNMMMEIQLTEESMLSNLKIKIFKLENGLGFTTMQKTIRFKRKKFTMTILFIQYTMLAEKYIH